MIEGWYHLTREKIVPLTQALAFDKASVRRVDVDGRLHVQMANISKANVCPYLGSEIPDHDTLKLDPNRIYKLFRAPDELAKAAGTFNNIPLLHRHVPVTAENHQPALVVGSTGTDAKFEAPYLCNSLVVWAQDAIEDIEDDRKRQLSCGYRYRADMTPGEFEGEKFDGVMRDIVANHVALVAEGRAGPDVIVGDEKKDFQMAKTLLSRKAAMVQGAMIAYLMPKLAADAKVDLTSVFAGITNKNIVERKPIILNGVRSAVKGKLAMDADIGDLVKLLDAVSSAPVADSEDPIADPAVDPAADPALAAPPVDPVPEAKDDDPTAAIMEFLQGKLTPEDLAQLQALMKPEAAADPAAAPPADPAAPPADPAAPPKDPAEDAEMDDLTANDQDDPAMQNTVSKPAMDAAIASAEARVIKTHRDIRDAERAVRPYVGDLAIACDSAESVYRHALKMLGVKGAETIHASALPAMLEMQPLPGARKTAPTLSMDAAAAKGFSDRFPETHRIRAI